MWHFTFRQWPLRRKEHNVWAIFHYTELAIDWENRLKRSILSLCVTAHASAALEWSWLFAMVMVIFLLYFDRDISMIVFLLDGSWWNGISHPSSWPMHGIVCPDSRLPPLYYPARMASAAFLFTHMLVVHRSEGGGIYCLGSGEPWKLHYDIKGAAAPAGRQQVQRPATRLRSTIFMKWQETTR